MIQLVTESSTAIRVQELSKHFGSIVGIKDINFEVPKGSFVTILGPSGCGKTTLLRCIAGVEEPDRGSIEIGGKLIFSSKEKISVPPEDRGVGMVYQSYALWPHMKVFENVAYPLKVRHSSPAEIKKKVNDELELLEISNLADRLPSTLSGGQQQRVALARALVYSPSILLLDEPLSNLDEQLRQSVRDDLKAIQRRVDVTTIYVTHDRSEALSLSDKIIVLSSGKLMAEGLPLELLQSPPNSFIASFLTGMLVMDGKVSSFDKNVVWLDTNLGMIGSTKYPSELLSIGKNLKVCVRPGTLQFADTPGANVISGEVKGLSLEADRTVYRILVGNQVVTIPKAEDERGLKKTGDVVFLKISESSVYLLEN
jgi:iron(III) transport system ATP-binding protein